MAYLTFGAGTYTLASSIGSTDTSIVLTSFTEPVTGTAYTMANTGTDIIFGTIGPGTSTSEFISFTGITQNGDGTATLTGVTRGLARKTPFTTDASYKQPHSGQTTFIISNPPQLYNKFVSIVNTETISGVKTFASGSTPKVIDAPLTDTEVANKLYVDQQVSAGAPDASTSTKGITKLSVAPASATDPIAAGTNDTRIPTQDENDALAGTSGTPSTSNKYVTNDDTATAATASKVARRLAGGNVTVVTESPGNNTTNAASTAYVDAGLALKVGTFTNGTTTKETGDASTTQNIAHGLGVAPKKVRITAIPNTTTDAAIQAFTVYNGTTQSSISRYTTALTAATTFTISVSGSGDQTGVVTVDTTNIIITWTKSGTPSGVFNLLWEAEA